MLLHLSVKIILQKTMCLSYLHVLSLFICTVPCMYITHILSASFKSKNPMLPRLSFNVFMVPNFSTLLNRVYMCWCMLSAFTLNSHTIYTSTHGHLHTRTYMHINTHHTHVHNHMLTSHPPHMYTRAYKLTQLGKQTRGKAE